MKASKKILSVLLSVLLVALTLSCLSACFTSSAAYAVGDVIEFGAYPQTRVEETEALSAAAAAATWKSYGYYSGTGVETDGNMAPGDWMQYADFVCDDMMYRAVKFTQYRPEASYEPCGANASNQDDNGYETNVTYYFKYEPLQWRILDPATGYIMCVSIVDAQAYQNVVYSADENHYYQGAGSDVYANKYAPSSIRAWLNGTFYNTAFTDAEKAAIQTTAVNNEGLYEEFSSPETNDKIFLFSLSEALNRNYGMNAQLMNEGSDMSAAAIGTDYAKCQGLKVFDSDYCAGYSEWWLRTSGWMDGAIPGARSRCSTVVWFSGMRGAALVYLSLGVRPVCVVPGLAADTSETPDDPDTPESDKTFFEKLLDAVRNFFQRIADFFRNLF